MTFGATHRFEERWSPVPSESGTSLTSHARMCFAQRSAPDGAARTYFAGMDETHLVRRLVSSAARFGRLSCRGPSRGRSDMRGFYSRGFWKIERRTGPAWPAAAVGTF